MSRLQSNALVGRVAELGSLDRMVYPTSVKGVLLVDHQVLLVKNSRDEWELPGGRIDEGEEHSQTLSREFAEELSRTSR